MEEIGCYGGGGYSDWYRPYNFKMADPCFIMFSGIPCSTSLYSDVVKYGINQWMDCLLSNCYEHCDFGDGFEDIEITCDDLVDNDCDNIIDGDDQDCY